MATLQEQVRTIIESRPQLRNLLMVDISHQKGKNTISFYRYDGPDTKYTLTQASAERFKSLEKKGIIEYSQTIVRPNRLTIIYNLTKEYKVR